MMVMVAVQAPLNLNYGGVGPCLPEQRPRVRSELCHFPDMMTRKKARFIE
jgi:hypothetical protein